MKKREKKIGQNSGNNKKKKSVSIGAFFLKIEPLKKLLFRQKNTEDYVRVMEPRARPEVTLTKLWEKRIGIFAVLIVAVGMMWLICFTSEPPEGALSGGRYLRRPESEEEIGLSVSGETEEGRWQKLFTFDVSERVFTADEKHVIGNRVDAYVSEKLPGKNTSLDQVDQKLSLVSAVPGTGVELSWTVDENYIREDGSLITSKVPQTGVDTEIMLEAKWKNYKGIFHYPVHLVSPPVSATKTAMKEAKREIKKALREQSTEAVVELPDGYLYGEEEVEKDYMPVFLLLALLIILPFFWKEQAKRGMAMREEQLLIDHPGFINKVMLLLGAGLTLRFTIERVVSEYERELADGGDRRFAYEELCVTMQELRDGVTESAAIENFGKRCRCMPYMRFASVVTQNLRKGAEGILAILEQEASDSLIERKQAALRKGEVAGTKLLFPMMVMLGLVMGIIMVPAFMSM